MPVFPPFVARAVLPAKALNDALNDILAVAQAAGGSSAALTTLQTEVTTIAASQVTDEADIALLKTEVATLTTEITGINTAISANGADLPLAGGTMTGVIILPPVAPTQPYQVPPKKYVDDTVAAYLPLAGGTLSPTGQIVVQTTPSLPMQLINKKYVDDAIAALSVNILPTNLASVNATYIYPAGCAYTYPVNGIPTLNISQGILGNGPATAFSSNAAVMSSPIANPTAVWTQLLTMDVTHLDCGAAGLSVWNSTSPGKSLFIGFTQSLAGGGVPMIFVEQLAGFMTLQSGGNNGVIQNTVSGATGTGIFYTTGAVGLLSLRIQHVLSPANQLLFQYLSGTGWQTLATVPFANSGLYGLSPDTAGYSISAYNNTLQGNMIVGFPVFASSVP